jgi:hypothetical protein
MSPQERKSPSPLPPPTLTANHCPLNRYTFNLSIGNGTLSSLIAVDGDGTTLETSVGNSTLQSGGDPHLVTVRFTESASNVALWAHTRETEVQVAYNVTYTAQAASAPSPSASPAPSMAGRSVLVGGAGGALLLAVGAVTAAVVGVLL